MIAPLLAQNNLPDSTDDGMQIVLLILAAVAALVFLVFLFIFFGFIRSGSRAC